MASPVSKTEKEKQKLVQEKCQTILAGMLRDEDNKYCVDCDAKGPRWASWNLGIFLCIRCAGIHRNLGVHISRVKSVNLDSWTPEQVVSLQQMGNSRARAVYEANLPDSFRRPQTDSTLESFIRAKYETKRYIAKEWVCPPPVKVSWDAEIEMELKRKKEAKRKTNGSPAFPVELPNPSSSRSRPSDTTSTNSVSSASTKESSSLPAPVEQPLPAPTKPSSAAQDLLGLDTVITSSGSNDLFGGLLTSNATTTTGSATNVPSAGGAPKMSEEDSFFNQKAPSTTEKRTLDKNSILALYNQGGTNTSAAIVPPMQNMFASQGFTSTQPAAYGTAPQMNQPSNMMATNYNPMMQGGNMFSSPMYPTNGAIPQTGAAQMGQLSQQLSGLNFGSAVHNPMMPASNPSFVQSGMMMNNATVPMAMNPGMVAAPNVNPYMFMSSTGIQPAPQQQSAQHASTLSSNLWQ